MAMLDEIYKVAAVFASPGEDDRETLRTLCTAAETELSASLRKDVRPEDCRGQATISRRGRRRRISPSRWAR